MLPLNATLCCHPVCKNIIHAEGVRCRGPVRAQESKVRFADQPAGTPQGAMLPVKE
jgi:hypothetical protein